MIEMIGATQVRPLPQKNATGQRDAGHMQYYTPEALARANRIFGPFMHRWGYELPPEWGGVSALGRVQFALLAGPRHLYWRFIRYNSGAPGRILRRLLGLKAATSTN
jgi:hypothetical protein